MRKLQRSPGIRLLGAALLGAVTVLAPVACGSANNSANDSADVVTIAGVWVGADETNFEHVLDQSGIHYVYQGSRALDQLLASDVRNGTEPDIAVVASPTVLSDYYHDENTDVKALNSILQGQNDQYSQQWLNLMRTPGKNGGQAQVGVVLKVDLKSIVWYAPKTLSAVLPGRFGEQTPPSWSSVAGLSGTPWCMGLGSNAVSGFPGTDWIEEIMLKSFGPTIYQAWADGAWPWDSPQVRSAFATWGTILAKVRGGSASALLTNFDQAANPMLLKTPPGCELDSEGSFITGVYEGLLNSNTDPNKQVDHAGKNYDFFPFPAIQPANANDYEVGGNFAGMFKDTPAAKALMKFLASEAGQQAWLDTGSYSADKQVPTTRYPDDVHRAISTVLTGNDPLSFDASDLMPDTVGNAFYQAVLAYAADPKTLNGSLTQLDQERCQLTTPTPANCPAGKDTTHG